MNLAEEIAQWQKTGNQAHATDILYKLAKVLDSSKRSSIERIQDVTVGSGSGAEIKSGLLWSVIDVLEAKNSFLHQRVKELDRQAKTVTSS